MTIKNLMYVYFGPRVAVSRIGRKHLMPFFTGNSRNALAIAETQVKATGRKQNELPAMRAMSKMPSASGRPPLPL